MEMVNRDVSAVQRSRLRSYSESTSMYVHTLQSMYRSRVILNKSKKERKLSFSVPNRTSASIETKEGGGVGLS